MGALERKIDVNKVKLHPKYRDPQQYFDVALIFLDEVSFFIFHLTESDFNVLTANNIHT